MATGREAVIVSAVRTPMGKFLGALAPLSAPQLGAVAIRAAVERARLDVHRVDEVIMGHVVSAGAGMAPARQAAIGGGIPEHVPALTINKICGSGLKAAMLAAQAIRAGDGEVYVVGGMESMSNAPHLLPQARTGYRLGHGQLIDANLRDGLWCAFEDQHMGLLAEFIAEKHGISREEMDAYALESHRKAVEATRAGRFEAEIVPVETSRRNGATTVRTDEPPRPNTSMEALARISPAFKEGGKVTAGNAPGLSDGAAALVVMEAETARHLAIAPLARITGYASVALEPRLIFEAPPLAIRKLLAQTGLSLEDLDLLEVNEAFSAQILANGKEMGWDWKRVNVNGGGVALGHPIGATGARILVTLVHALRQRGGRRGLAALCLGGGGAVAMSVEVV